MAKYNVILKMKRERAQERKRAVLGDPNSGKLKLKQMSTTPTSLSGKRKQKLLRKWRRGQKEAVEKGLITAEDVEMVSTEEGRKEKGIVKIPMKKKSSKLQIKQLKGKGRKKGKGGKANSKPKVDVMVE